MNKVYKFFWLKKIYDIQTHNKATFTVYRLENFGGLYGQINLFSLFLEKIHPFSLTQISKFYNKFLSFKFSITLIIKFVSEKNLSRPKWLAINSCSALFFFFLFQWFNKPYFSFLFDCFSYLQISAWMDDHQHQRTIKLNCKFSVKLQFSLPPSTCTQFFWYVPLLSYLCFDLMLNI